MCLHLVGLTTVYLLPLYLRGEKSTKHSSNGIEKSTNNVDNVNDINDHNKCDIKLSNNKTTDQNQEESSNSQNRNSLDEFSNENNHLSQKIRERINSETRNIEDFIDKTVTGMVELKDDLMRFNDNEMYANQDGLRKRASTDGHKEGNDVDAFLRKEINMAVNQKLPAVLSNGNGD